MPHRSARGTQVSSDSSSLKLAKSGNSFSTLTTRPNMVALAVAASMLPVGVHAEWKPNIELFYTYSAETGSSSDRQFGGAQALIPLRQDGNSMTFGDLRANWGEHGTNEQNIGIGHRWFNASRDWIFGGYGFFDSRESINNNRFNQVSIGAEALSVVWDVRANYYYPIDDAERIGIGKTFFQGNGVFANGVVEEPLEGFDAEVGYLLPGIPWETRAFVGGYTFDGDYNRDSVDGYRVRLETRPRKNIILGLAYQDDDTFDSQTFVQLKYSFGYDGTAAHRTLDERMVQLPVRDIDVVITPAEETTAASQRQVLTNSVLHIQKDHDNIDPDTGYDEFGRGTYENPYASIEECYVAGDCATTDNGDAEYNWIYVHGVLDEPGPDGNGRTTVATPYDGYFELLDNQHLIGQGVGIFGIGTEIAAPEIRWSGPGPTVVLAQNNEVAGLDIEPGGFDGFDGMETSVALIGGGSDAIYGHNVSGFDIHDNLLHGNMNGVHLEYDVNNETVDGNGSITNNHIADQYGDYGYGGHGVYIEINGSGGTFNQTLDLTGNEINYNHGDGVRINGAFPNDLIADISPRLSGFMTINQSLTLSDNEIKHNADGLVNRLFAVYGGEIAQRITLTDNDISDNYGGGNTGVAIDTGVFSSGSIDQAVTLTRNTLNANGGDGVEIGAWATTFDSSAPLSVDQGVTLNGNTIIGNDYDGVDIQLHAADGFGGTSQAVDINGNTINNNYSDGVRIGLDLENRSGTATSMISLSGNDISANMDEERTGVYINTTLTSTILEQSIGLSNNTINNNLGDGVHIETSATMSSTLDQVITLTGNTLDNNSDDGVEIYTYISDSSHLNQSVTLTSNEIQNNDDGGANIYTDIDSWSTLGDQVISMSNNTITGNDSTGVYIDTEINSWSSAGGQVITLTNNDISGNHSTGVYISTGISSWSSLHSQDITLTGNDISGSGSKAAGAACTARTSRSPATTSAAAASTAWKSGPISQPGAVWITRPSRLPITTSAAATATASTSGTW